LRLALRVFGFKKIKQLSLKVNRKTAYIVMLKSQKSACCIQYIEIKFLDWNYLTIQSEVIKFGFPYKVTKLKQF
jgi:hypothetical protein